jgi:hypothetical protein
MDPKKEAYSGGWGFKTCADGLTEQGLERQGSAIGDFGVTEKNHINKATVSGQLGFVLL